MCMQCVPHSDVASIMCTTVGGWVEKKKHLFFRHFFSSHAFTPSNKASFLQSNAFPLLTDKRAAKIQRWRRWQHFPFLFFFLFFFWWPCTNENVHKRPSLLLLRFNVKKKRDRKNATFPPQVAALAERKGGLSPSGLLSLLGNKMLFCVGVCVWTINWWV